MGRRAEGSYKGLLQDALNKERDGVGEQNTTEQNRTEQNRTE